MTTTDVPRHRPVSPGGQTHLMEKPCSIKSWLPARSAHGPGLGRPRSPRVPDCTQPAPSLPSCSQTQGNWINSEKLAKMICHVI